MPTLAEYATVLTRPSARLQLCGGQSADVLIDACAGEVWRFPRTAAARDRLLRDRDKLRRARHLGLPASAVLGGNLDGPPGQARLWLRFIPGVGLDHLGVELPAPAESALVDDLAVLLLQLRGATLDGWPASEPTWVEHWSDLATRMDECVLPRLTDAGADRARHELHAALDAARAATISLVHGDLGGANVRINPDTGRLNGILDWDGAAPGDSAVDVAALQASLPDGTWRLLAGRLQLQPVELDRAAAYTATFALQDALLGAEDGDRDAIARGLAGYERMPI